MSTSSGDDGLRLKKPSIIERLDKTSQLTLQQELLVRVMVPRIQMSFESHAFNI